MLAYIYKGPLLGQHPAADIFRMEEEEFEDSPGRNIDRLDINDEEEEEEDEFHSEIPSRKSTGIRFQDDVDAEDKRLRDQQERDKEQAQLHRHAQVCRVLCCSFHVVAVCCSVSQCVSVCCVASCVASFTLLQCPEHLDLRSSRPPFNALPLQTVHRFCVTVTWGVFGLVHTMMLHTII